MNSRLTGADIRAWRERQNLTQDEGAKLLGIAREWLSKVENGRKAVSADLHERVMRHMRDSQFTSGHTAELAAPLTSEFEGSSGVNRSTIFAELDRVLAATQERPERLAWVLEQLRAHLVIPRHWGVSPTSDDAETARQRRIEELRAKMPPVAGTTPPPGQQRTAG